MTVSEEGPVDSLDAGKFKGPSLSAAPSIEEQASLVKHGLEETFRKGDTWYLIDTRWFSQWKKYVGYNCRFTDTGQDSAHPGPIDNSALFKDINTSDALKEHLMEEAEYGLLSKTSWNYLCTWYGIIDEKHTINRTVREHGQYVKDLKVEVYLTELKLCMNNDVEDCIVKRFSKTVTLDDVIKEMKNAFNVPENTDTRLWSKYMTNTYELLTDTQNTIQDTGLYDGQVILLEPKNEDGTWPRQTRSSSISSCSGLSASPLDTSAASSALSSSPISRGISSYGMSYGSFGSYSGEAGRRRTSSSGSHASREGLCGLSNLGNTCFMNSAVQCLSNTAPLTKYFLANSYLQELNPQNPLGMRGEIAKAYAELMHQIWSGYNSHVAPRNFKIAVGRFAPQFSGYQQQDSHELLSFLLDGLHEDLNRVKKKPYVEIPDHNGRPDEELAKEAWSNHQLRNNSIIVDFFHGQFKSTVVCPECDKISVTFDPFCYLSLPLPVHKERNMNVTFVPLEPSRKPAALNVTMPKTGTIKDLAVAVSKKTGVDSTKLVLTDVYSHRFHKIFERRETLSQITDRDDIYAYEIPMSVANHKDSELIVLPVYLRLKRPTLANSYSYGGSASLFGTPLLVPIPRKGVSYDDLYRILIKKLRRIVRQPTRKEFETEMTENENDDDDEKKIRDENHHKEETYKDMDMEEESGAEREDELTRIFSISSVNTYGSSDLDTFDDDATELELTSKTYLSLNWDVKYKETYYDSVAAEEKEEQKNFSQKPLIKKSIQLQNCLELFLTKEKLGVEDPWYCPTCKRHQQASKKFDLWGLPTVLIIHLKRFSYNRWWRDKLDSLVEFPIRDLNLTPYVINENHPPAVYDLHAVSNHYGGMGGGHYTAYAKNSYDGKWYYFDDSSVSLADENQIVSKAAYVLFYTRRKDPTHPPCAANELLSDDESALYQTQDGDDSEMET